MNRAVALFAKPIVPGRVKTRLSPPLSATEGAILYAAFLTDLAHMLDSGSGWDWMVYSTEPARQRDTWPERAPHPCAWRQQHGTDLGERIETALEELLSEGREAAVVVGSDHPSLGAETIGDAFAALATADVVLGPTRDGGYYLVGLKAPSSGLLRGIPWSTRHVLERTLDRIEERELVPALLPLWYDVDTVDDLRFLRVHLRGLALGSAPRSLHTLDAMRRIDVPE
jgi:rSAM/selenodomain-associated transferase 1